MISAIIDTFNTKVGSMKDLSDKYKLREGFNHKDSFSQDLMYQINKKISDIPTDKSKAFLILNALVSNLSIRDFILFSSIGEKAGKGGIKTISVPELEIEDHLILWSDVYGVGLLSAKTFNEGDPESIDGDHFIIFDCLPPFVIGISINEGKASIISEIPKNEINDKKAELIGDFAVLVFDEWSKFRDKNDIESVFEFSFLSTNNMIEC